jgi:hypothetical protein
MGFHRRLYRVAKQLRYRTLPELIGRSILIPSIRDVLGTVASSFELGSPVNPDARFEGMIAKYGILDLEFHSLQPNLGRQDRGGVALLKELCFVHEDRTEENLEEEDWCLELLEESISERQIVKLFLRCDLDLHGNPRDVLQHSAPPCTFVVTDACLTNADYVWFNKHFYL